MDHHTSDQHLEIAPPSALELLWINHRSSVLGGAAALVAVGLVVLGVLYSKNSARIASESLLSQAKDNAGLQAVISKYPDSPASANAMLLLAASLRNTGKIEESDEVYSRFAESFPNSTLAVCGMLGRAANARVSNHLDAALNSYQQAAAAYPQSYGAPFALFSEVQLLAQNGRQEEAKKVLQALTSQYPGSIAAMAFGGRQSQEAAASPQ